MEQFEPKSPSLSAFPEVRPGLRTATADQGTLSGGTVVAGDCLRLLYALADQAGMAESIEICRAVQASWVRGLRRRADLAWWRRCADLCGLHSFGLRQAAGRG